MECMLDIETLGIRPGSAIRSVGAAAFELGGDGVASTFSMNVRAMSCWVAGLTVDQSTIDWWGKQSAAAQEAAKVDQRDLKEVVAAFHAWYVDNRCQGLWGHGANFDSVLWERAASALGAAVPWKFYQVRCTRTLHHAANFDPRSLARDGTYHAALDDALFQVKCAQAAWKIVDVRKRAAIFASAAAIPDPTPNPAEEKAP